MGMRVLVTGGAGFIGSHVSEALLRRGDDVVCLDNLDDYYDPREKRRNLGLVRETAEEAGQRFTFVEGDIRDPDLLQQLAKRENLDAVIHLAARAGVRPSIEEVALYADVNVSGTCQLLEMAREFEIGNFVFASSSSVYGERTETPFCESDSVDRPVSPYAATKKAGELLCSTYHHLFGINISCLRFFTVYGPRQRPEMAIARFTHRIDHDESVPLFAEGKSLRDFTYIDDIVDGVLRALDRNQGYHIYNLGNHAMISVQDLVACIGRALDKTPKVELLPAQPGDVSTTCASTDLSRRELGYEPKTPIEDGVRRYVEWYLTQKNRTP